MASLKQKATGKSSSKLAQATESQNVATPVQGSDPIEPMEGTAPTFDAPPPLLPPAYRYIQIFAEKPGLRKKAGMGPT